MILELGARAVAIQARPLDRPPPAHEPFRVRMVSAGQASRRRHFAVHISLTCTHRSRVASPALGRNFLHLLGAHHTRMGVQAIGERSCYGIYANATRVG